MRSAVAWGLVAAVVVGCATSAPIRDVRELAGTWRGRMSGPLGHAVADMTIKEDGGYTGTMYLDTGDREFRGTIVVIDPQSARFAGMDGSGTVRQELREGRTVLRFMLDGSGAGATYTRAP